MLVDAFSELEELLREVRVAAARARKAGEEEVVAAVADADGGERRRAALERALDERRDRGRAVRRVPVGEQDDVARVLGESEGVVQGGVHAGAVPDVERAQPTNRFVTDRVRELRGREHDRNARVERDEGDFDAIGQEREHSGGEALRVHEPGATHAARTIDGEDEPPSGRWALGASAELEACASGGGRKDRAFREDVERDHDCGTREGARV